MSATTVRIKRVVIATTVGVGDRCIVAGSYANMSFEVAVTVWGRVLPQAEFDAEELLEFVRAYRGVLGPEAGVCGQVA